MKNFIYILILTLFSCKENNRFCENKLQIFDNKNLVEIQLDLNNNYKNIKKQIYSQTDKDLCGIDFIFNKSYKKESIKLPFKSFDCRPDIRIHPNMITFLFNEKGEFLLESELVEIKNVTNFIKENIVNQRKRRQTKTFYISFQLKTIIKDSIFNTVIENTIDGVHLYYKELSLKKFNKEFCELDSSELKKITSEFEFAFTSYEFPQPILMLPSAKE